MIASRANPFNVTKAVDFTDEEIASYFVDMPGAGFGALADPKSPMPMLILGGKGSGKTHLMRYFSYPLQKLRHAAGVIRGVHDDGFIGVYFRCGGLNSTRFRGKNQSEDVWNTVFAYYMELWLGQLVLSCTTDLMRTDGTALGNELSIVNECVTLLDDFQGLPSVSTLDQYRETLHQLQRELDIAVNNCALTRKLDVRIRATSGRLVFGIPQILAASVGCLKRIQFLYLIDEYENLTEAQQRYVNTLLREKELPCSFKIGGRVYGFKTFKTYSDQEEIKEGSEYEVLPLDARLRDNKQYATFAERLCARRIIQAGYAPSEAIDPDLVRPMLREAFDTFEVTPLFQADTAFVQDKYRTRERPYFVKLRERLEEGRSAGVAPGISSEQEILQVVRSLQCPELPILEKVNIFRLYQQWRSSKNLVTDAAEIAGQCRLYIAGTRGDEYASIVEKRKGDLLAQLLRECDQKQRYLGFDTFLEMSEGLPRNLLVILKSIFNWAAFNGETPFKGGKISMASQREGVREAAEWFFDDARMPGDDGTAIRSGVGRLATLFREIRFSDKPSEKAISTFSVDLSQCTPETQRIVRLAEKWSLLIVVSGGQRDRNTMRVDEKLYINPMLAPKWDLPVTRGGALELSPLELDAMFDSRSQSEFDRLLSERVARMSAPLFGSSKKKGGNGSTSLQTHLPLARD